MSKIESPKDAATDTDKAGSKASQEHGNPTKAEWKAAQDAISAAEKHYGNSSQGSKLDHNWEAAYLKDLPSATINHLAIEFGERHASLMPKGEFTKTAVGAVEAKEKQDHHGVGFDPFATKMLDTLGSDASKVASLTHDKVPLTKNVLEFFGAIEQQKLDGHDAIKQMFPGDSQAMQISNYLDTFAHGGTMDGRISAADIKAALDLDHGDALTKKLTDIGLTTEQIKTFRSAAQYLVKNWNSIGVHSELNNGFLTPTNIDQFIPNDGGAHGQK